MRLTSKYPFASSLVCLLLVVVPGYAMLENQQDELEQEARERCQDRRDVVVTLRLLIEESDQGGGGLRLTQVEGFEALSSEMQTYLTNLENASRRSVAEGEDPRSFKERALALLPPLPECG